MLSPAKVFVPEVSGAQSDATYYQPEQDIIQTHDHCSLAVPNYSGLKGARPEPHRVERAAGCRSTRRETRSDLGLRSTLGYKEYYRGSAWIPYISR